MQSLQIFKKEFRSKREKHPGYVAAFLADRSFVGEGTVKSDQISDPAGGDTDLLNIKLAMRNYGLEMRFNG